MVRGSDDIAHGLAEVLTNGIHIYFWVGQFEVLEEYTIEVVVVILAGMGKNHIKIFATLVNHSGKADNLGSCADYDEKLKLPVILKSRHKDKNDKKTKIFSYLCLMKTEELIRQIIQCIYNVRGELLSGFLESVYKHALLHELSLSGLPAEAEREIVVQYKGTQVGYFRADIVVADRVIIELKAVDALTKAHEVQLVNYLTATGIENGILVNFGENFAIKRKFKTYRSKR